MKIHPTSLRHVFLVETTSVVDSRGAFARLYCERELTEVIADRCIVQVNHSRTKSCSAIRGMHYQHPPYAEMKLIRCTRGRLWDVAVDLRQGSPTYLQWHAEELTPLTSAGSYYCVFDTVIEDMPDDIFPDRPWASGNNPKTAVWEYLKRLKEQGRKAADGAPLAFEIDKTIEDKLLITVAPDGYLKRV